MATLRSSPEDEAEVVGRNASINVSSGRKEGPWYIIVWHIENQERRE